MKSNFRTILALGAMTALTACGQNAHQQAGSTMASSAPAPPSDWSMTDLASVEPQVLDAGGPLPQAVPMQAADESSYSPAPSFDYAPQSAGTAYAPLDASYYASNPSSSDYALLALAASLGGMLGDAPPDYAFAYDGVQPWAWQTGNGYARYAEPVAGGYRYYYYAPHADRPFLVRDPYYSYGYRNGGLAVIYDRDGRVVDAQRAQRERQAAQTYYARAERLYRAAQHDRHEGVSAPRWQRQQAEIAREQQQWNEARRQRPAWQRWDAHNEPRLKRDWASEAVVRRQAATSFANWHKANFRTPPPRPYTKQQRQADLQKVAEIRRQQQAQRNQLTQRAEAQRRVGQQQQAEARKLTQQRQQMAKGRQEEQAQVRQQKAQHAQLQARHQAQINEANRIAHQKVVAARQQQAAEHRTRQATIATQRLEHAIRAAQRKAQRADAVAQQARQARQAAQHKAQQAKAAEQKAERTKAANAREAARSAEQKRQAEPAHNAAERKVRTRSAGAARQAAQHSRAPARAAKPAHKAAPAKRPAPAAGNGKSRKNKHDDGRG